MDAIFRFFFGSRQAIAMTTIVALSLLTALAPNLVANAAGAVAGAAVNGVLIVVSRVMEKTIMRREVQDLIVAVIAFLVIWKVVRPSRSRRR